MDGVAGYKFVDFSQVTVPLSSLTYIELLPTKSFTIKNLRFLLEAAAHIVWKPSKNYQYTVLGED